MQELIELVISKLGATEGQAKGGLGLLLKLAKDQLGSDFSGITDVLGNVQDLLNAAPEAGGTSKLIGGLASALGGEKLGGLASVAGGFKELDLDARKVGDFAELLIGFLKDKGGSNVAGLLQKLIG